MIPKKRESSQEKILWIEKAYSKEKQQQ